MARGFGEGGPCNIPAPEIMSHSPAPEECSSDAVVQTKASHCRGYGIRCTLTVTTPIKTHLSIAFMTLKQILRLTSLATPVLHPPAHRVPIGLANSVSP